MTFPTGRFVWFEYVSKDIKKAQGFFGELFNWKTQVMPTPDGGSYTMISINDQSIGGYLDTPKGAPEHAHWLSHLQVESAASTAAKIKSLGGKVLKDPVKMGELGTYAVVADPQGGVFALWQPGKPEASEYKGIDGAFCWNELITEQPAKAVEFYTQVGGFTHEAMAMPGLTYDILNNDGKGRAGIAKAQMPNVPQHWMQYVQVKNADQTTEKAKKLGAKVVIEPTDIPTVGRLAVFIDPQGASIGILQPAAS